MCEPRRPGLVGPPGFHTTAHEPKRAHLRVPVFKNTTKIQRKSPPERGEKNKNCGGRGKKKSEILGGPAEGCPAEGCPAEGCPAEGCPAGGGGSGGEALNTPTTHTHQQDRTTHSNTATQTSKKQTTQPTHTKTNHNTTTQKNGLGGHKPLTSNFGQKWIGQNWLAKHDGQKWIGQRCKQVTFYDGPGCGTCTFDLPVSKTDLQALGKRRTHTCACLGGVPGSDALCPVKVARSLYAAAYNFAPPGANPKRLATLTFQKLARLGGMDSRITGHVCRVTGAQAMAVAGIELWLIQASCRWGSRAVFEYVRDCQLASATDVAVRVAKGLQLMEVRESVYQRLEGGPELQAASERVFEEALEESVQGVSIVDLQADQVKEQIQGRALDAARVGPVRFVSCAEVGMGKAHVWKTDAVTWCGRRWVHMVTEVLPEMERCRRCLRAVAVGVSGGVVQVLDP